MDTRKHYLTFCNKAKYIVFSSLLLLVLVFQNLSAQQYFVKSYTAEDGLPTRIVTDVCQDKTGYMWFTTYSGVSKYDGFSFTNYDTTNGLPNQQFRKIVCDENGIIWAVPYFTHGKLVLFKDNKWKSIKIPNLPKESSYITSFDVSYHGNEPVVCIGSYRGVDVYADNKWAHYNISDIKESNVVYGVTEKKRSFYLATKLGLCILKGSSLNWDFNTKINPGNEAIYAIKFEKPDSDQGRMWVMTNHSIGYYQNDILTIDFNPITPLASTDRIYLYFPDGFA